MNSQIKKRTNVQIQMNPVSVKPSLRVKSPLFNQFKNGHTIIYKLLSLALFGFILFFGIMIGIANSNIKRTNLNNDKNDTPPQDSANNLQEEGLNIKDITYKNQINDVDSPEPSPVPQSNSQAQPEDQYPESTNPDTAVWESLVGYMQSVINETNEAQIGLEQIEEDEPPPFEEE